jgi:hypothetical protein
VFFISGMDSASCFPYISEGDVNISFVICHFFCVFFFVRDVGFSVYSIVLIVRNDTFKLVSLNSSIIYRTSSLLDVNVVHYLLWLSEFNMEVTSVFVLVGEGRI